MLPPPQGHKISLVKSAQTAKVEIGTAAVTSKVNYKGESPFLGGLYMETVLQLLKIDLGISHNLRDAFFHCPVLGGARLKPYP